MSSKEWDQFFSLPNLSADEKGKEVIRQAKKAASDGDFEEFVSWFDGDASEEVM